MHQNSYIGPYVKVICVVIEKKIDQCAEHNFPSDASYCPKCGISKNKRIRTVESSDAPDNWMENYKKRNFHDYLYSCFCLPIGTVNGRRQKANIYLPNRHYKELNIIDIGGRNMIEEEKPFDNLDMKGVIEKFKQLFADELAYLAQWFEVEVKFGCVSYWS